MKVLMFGWEFPPFSKGGLGTACYGLTKGLKNKNVDVTFVLPKAPSEAQGGHVTLLAANNVYLDEESESSCITKCYEIGSLLSPYVTEEQYARNYKDYISANRHRIKYGNNTTDDDDPYGADLAAEVIRFGEKAKLISAVEDFDVIHAHDWMTYQAGMNAKAVTGKPLVVHVHATEFDRSGGAGCNPVVYNLERTGMHAADKVITVSEWTKKRVIESYGVPADKVHVVHNAVDFDTVKFDKDKVKLDKDEKMVLFLGRVTQQKGPEYFMYSAKAIKDMAPELNVKFVFAGSGDMHSQMVNMAAELGLSKDVMFTGWVKGPEIDRLYSMADLYVMPSVSEPFGITPLESMRNGTPVLISKQSGVSEVVSHALKVDFWDVEDMADKMLSVLRYPSLQKELMNKGSEEVLKFSWDIPAAKCANVYQMAMNMYNMG